MRWAWYDHHRSRVPNWSPRYRPSKLEPHQQSGAPLFPAFKPDLAKLFYGLHTCFVTIIAAEIGEILHALYGSGLNDLGIEMLTNSLKILGKFGWVKS
jgi:hypothetical protein